MDDINLQSEIEPTIPINIKESEVLATTLTTKYKRNDAEIGYRKKYAANRDIAEGMMDLALLTANANQLRFLITYNSHTSTFYLSVGLIILSLILQVAVGIALIFQRKNCKKSRMLRTNQFLIVGVFMVTFVNILVAAFTSTDNKEN